MSFCGTFKALQVILKNENKKITSDYLKIKKWTIIF